MKMNLYKLFSCNVEIQYKSYFLSKATLFTLITTGLTLFLPLVLAYRSRGFWLKSHSYFEQPTVHFNYEYLLAAETEDPSQPIICKEAANMESIGDWSEEYCAAIQVQEDDYNSDAKNDALNMNFNIKIPPQRTITSVMLLLSLDFQLKSICLVHMQSLAIISKDFAVPPSGLKYSGDLQLYQTAHFPCTRHHVDNLYNVSLFNYVKDNVNIVDFILERYFSRQVITETKSLYSRSQNGHTGDMNISVRLRIPQVQVHYIPSLLQELKWAWPQYLSLAFIFHWIFYKVKKFVFTNRLVMAWEVVPWKRN